MKGAEQGRRSAHRGAGARTERSISQAASLHLHYLAQYRRLLTPSLLQTEGLAAGEGTAPLRCAYYQLALAWRPVCQRLSASVAM